MRWESPRTSCSSAATSVRSASPAPDGRAFTVGNVEAAVMTLEMASGDLSEGEFTAWVRIHARIEG